jgi:hypothetical protein
MLPDFVHDGFVMTDVKDELGVGAVHQLYAFHFFQGNGFKLL